MSKHIRDVAVDMLEPLVGRAMATVYVSDAILRLGKDSVSIGPDDMGAFCDGLRAKLSPFAARPVLDQVMADIGAFGRALED